MGLTIFAILALTGCKSLDSVRSKQPVDTGVTNKNVNEFSACVSSTWARNGTSVTSLPLENGISILVPQAMGGYDVVLDVTGNDAGSSYVLYERIPALTSALYEETVKLCR
ncbi:hypothetical protein FEM41_19845 [Jejubacter calystegiae]|uniref:Lipoprotein n=1 Tax=Jejubacter calystegiae TaxID=2579935 RepID=A0A4P8YRF5_9ENTR|nr:hypothetical protein FEM41_19845 [Jejubacter calystegiae]